MAHPDTEENKELDTVLNEARKKAVKSANATRIFGKVYNVCVKSNKVILAKKKLG